VYLTPPPRRLSLEFRNGCGQQKTRMMPLPDRQKVWRYMHSFTGKQYRQWTNSRRKHCMLTRDKKTVSNYLEARHWRYCTNNVKNISNLRCSSLPLARELYSCRDTFTDFFLRNRPTEDLAMAYQSTGRNFMLNET